MGNIIGSAVGLRGEIPKPLGVHAAIGTLLFRPNESCPAIHVFYPGSPNDDTKKGFKAPYMREEAASALAEWLGLSFMGFVLRKRLPSIPHPLIRNALPFTSEDGEAWPVIIFSHGLGGSLDLYSKTCADLASHGYVVVAIEHEDGSGSYSFPVNADKPLVFQKPPSGMKYTRESVQQFRRPFLEKRLSEVQSILDYLSNKAGHKEPANELPQVKRDCDAMAEAVFKRINVDKIFLAGHSFGAASTVFCSYQKELRDLVKGCILMDIWPYPLPSQMVEEGMFHRTISILSEQFAKNDESPVTLELAKATKDKSTVFLSYFLKGTLHSQFADVPWWTKKWLGKAFGAVGDSPVSVSQNALILSVVSFLKGDNTHQKLDTLEPFYVHPKSV